jgi:hypothetical protein
MNRATYDTPGDVGIPRTIVSNEKLNKAWRCVVDQVELVPIWYLFGAMRPRVVTRYLVKYGRKICLCIDCQARARLHVRKLTEFESTLFDVGDQLSYSIDYLPGKGCHDHSDT